MSHQRAAQARTGAARSAGARPHGIARMMSVCRVAARSVLYSAVSFTLTAAVFMLAHV
jgi:hypothetical protein